MRTRSCFSSLANRLSAFRHSMILMIALCCGAGVELQAQVENQAEADRSAVAIETLISELGSPIFAEREAAEAELLARGELARSALTTARDSADPEVRWRSNRALAELDAAQLQRETPSRQQRLTARRPFQTLRPAKPPALKQEENAEGEIAPEGGVQEDGALEDSQGEPGKPQRSEMRFTIRRGRLGDDETLDRLLEEQQEQMERMRQQMQDRFGGREDGWNYQLQAPSMAEMQEIMRELERQLDESFREGFSGSFENDFFDESWSQGFAPQILLPDVERLPPGPRLGVQISPVSAVLAAHIELPAHHGVVVDGVVPGSIAERAGILAHDILTAVGGIDVASGDEIVKALETIETGGASTLAIVRKGQPLTLDFVRDR